MNRQQLYESVTAVRPLLAAADIVDIKKIDGEGVALRPFIAGMLSYYPVWIKLLYAIRWGFVRLLGMKQPRLSPSRLTLQPQDVPFTPGQWATIFQVTAAAEDAYWIGEATDKHLTAYLAIVPEPQNGRRLFHVVTLVHYHHWTGPVYFNVIRPFHHIVVGAMMRAGVRQPQKTAVFL